MLVLALGRSAESRSRPPRTAAVFWIALSTATSRQAAAGSSQRAPSGPRRSACRSPRVAIQRSSRVGSGTSPASAR